MVRNTLDHLLKTSERYFSPATVARARLALGSPQYFNPFGGPMNGQTARLEAVRQILFRCDIKQIVETGTYRGTTTEWLAGFGLPVVTIESYLPSYEFSSRRLRSKSNVEVKLGSSVEVLPTIIEKNLDTSVPTFFYLDAHWEKYLPLRDELAIILPNFPSAVVLIDDFQVPGENGYGFDDYGRGKALTAEYLVPCLRPDSAVYYPSAPAAQETGWRRGWVVLTCNADIARELDKIELFRSQNC
jgi:hypothetical protein